MKIELKTKKGYNFYVIVSLLQKAIRRNDAKMACYAGLELFHSGYFNYLWKRLLIISAEDIYSPITLEIWALYQAFLLIRKNNKNVKNAGRLFVCKAILILCRAEKSRDADHVTNLFYDIETIPEKELQEYINANDGKIEMPDYAYDCHTAKGKRMGRTRKDFFITEQLALSPKKQTEFDELIKKLLK